MYEKYNVYRAREGELSFVGSVSAESAEQAVYRLAGGAWGRSDFAALNAADLAKVKAMAAERAAALKALDS